MPIGLRELLDDFDDLASAHEAYLEVCKKLQSEGSEKARIASTLASVLQRNVERLGRAFTNAPPELDRTWRPDAFVFVGDAGKQIFTRQVQGKAAVLLDLDLVLRLVLLIYFVGMDVEEDVVSDSLAAFLLLSIVVPRDEEFPRLIDLLHTAARHNKRVLDDLFAIVSTFVVFHELGHSYISQCKTDFLRVAFSIPPDIKLSPELVHSTRMHKDGIVYGQIDVPGSAKGVLIIKSDFEHWKTEFSADVFAAYAGVLAGADGKPRARDLEKFASALVVTQVVLFALGYRQQYMRAIAGNVESIDFSHPVANARVDVLIHHINFLAEAFAPDWQSPTLALFQPQFDSLWSKDLATLLQDGIEYVRYAFDAVAPHINVGKVFTFTDAPVPHVPSALSKLEKFFLEPFLNETNRIGWKAAVKNNMAEYVDYIRTFRLNDRPIVLELGNRLHQVNIKLISEDRS